MSKFVPTGEFKWVSPTTFHLNNLVTIVQKVMF